MAELGVGYVSIVAQTSGMQKAISDALKNATESIPEAPGKTIGSRLASGMGKALKVGAVATGAAVAGTLGTAIAKGFSRLTNIDQAEAKLRGLGHTADGVATIMDSANAAVKGTAFGLDEAATTAAGAVAAGIAPGEELQRTLTLMGDAATIAGTDMASMGSIVNKVATSDMMQMDVANQMMDAGIPILQMVADEMGVTADEARKMASEGKINFETFQTALENGLGGAAQESGNTFRGAMANMGASLGRFGAKLIDPIFSSAPAAFGAIGGAFDLLGEKVGPVAEMIGEWLAPRVEEFASNLGPWLESAIENVSSALSSTVDGLKTTVEWVQENDTWIKPLAATVGVLAGAYQVLRVQQTLTAAGGFLKWFMDLTRLTKVQTAAQAAFNLVMNANPIFLIVTAVAALVAGLVIFFTKTELGQEIWGRFTSALSTAYETIIKPVFEGIVTAGKILFAVLATAVLTPLMIAWNLLSTTVKIAYDSVIRPTIDAFAAAGSWLYNTVLQPVFSWIGDKWQQTADRLSAGWQWIRANAIDPFAAGIQNFWGSYVSPILTWIGDKWDVMAGVLESGRQFIVGTVFSGLESALDKLKGFFSTIVDGIRVVWDNLRGHLAKPINFMIGKVYNEGILAAWNLIAGILPGLEEGKSLPLISGFNTGGAVYGQGTSTSDSIPAMLSTGEHVLDAMDVQKMGGQGNVYRMRHWLDSGQPFTFDGRGVLINLPKTDTTAGDLLGAAPDLFRQRFSEGGEVRPLWELQLERAHRFARDQHGKPYQWAGPNGPGSSFDCSGFQGSIAATIQGDDPWRRYWATMSFPSPGAQGFVPGLGPGFSIGIWNGGEYGGHTAGTLGPVGAFASTNVESGGSPSMVKYGVGAVGADHSQFVMRYHLPIGADGAFVSGGAGASPEEMQNIIAEKLRGGIDKVLGPIVGLLPQGPPAWLDIPHGMYETGRDGLSDFVASGVLNIGDKLATVYTAVTEMGDLVRDAASGVWNWARDAILRDQGGIVRHGQTAVNMSGRDELMLPPSTTTAFNNFLLKLPGTAGAMERATVALHKVTEDIGIQARQSAEDQLAQEATSALSLVGLGGIVEIGVGLGEKIQAIIGDAEVQEGIKTVKLDPTMQYNGAEIEKKLRELGLAVEQIKGDLGGSVLGGIISMA